RAGGRRLRRGGGGAGGRGGDGGLAGLGHAPLRDFRVPRNHPTDEPPGPSRFPTCPPGVAHPTAHPSRTHAAGLRPGSPARVTREAAVDSSPPPVVTCDTTR